VSACSTTRHQPEMRRQGMTTRRLALNNFALFTISLTYVILPGTARANDWEKYYRPNPNASGTIPSTVDPEMLPSSGSADADIEQMWRRGFASIGATAFNTTNNKTDDAIRLAKKLQARYLILNVNLSSSQTTVMPMTVPHATTTYSNGNVSAYGSGGYANGSYSGTATTYGSQTTYIPIRINRFTKQAIYFQEVPKYGLGVMSRPLNNYEASNLGTRHAFVVRAIRDGSPADRADILPGDIIIKIGGQPFDTDILHAAISGPQPITLHLVRNGVERDLQVTVPPEWQHR